MSMPQGISNMNFYQMIEFALQSRGIPSLAEFFRTNTNYWYQDEIWKTLFPLESYENLTREFQQKIGQTYLPVMASYLADDAETPLITNEGFKKQTGEIPRMGNGYLFTSKTYEDARRLAALYGINESANQVLKALYVDSNKLIQSIHSQRSFTSLQVESKGFYLSTRANNVGGLEHFRISMTIPDQNKKKAGGYARNGSSHGKKYVWTSDNSFPAGDLRDMWYHAWSQQILPQDKDAAVFRMNSTQYEILKGHPTTKVIIGLWKTGYLVDQANLSKIEVTDEDLSKYFSALGLPEIEVSKYFGFTQYIDADTQKIMKNGIAAFADDTVVLRKKGTIGTFQWSKVSNIFATASSPVYYADNNSMAIQEDNYVTQGGIKMSINSLCVPVPRATESMLYLKTNEVAV